MAKRKYLPISVHPTLQGQLEVNWKTDYKNEYYCPYCQTSKLADFYYKKEVACQVFFRCKDCQKETYLVCQISKHKYSPISTHPTLNGTLNINWKQEYHGEFRCPYCNQRQLKHYQYFAQLICKLYLKCNYCEKSTFLTCPVPARIYSYLPDIVCPNPLCTQIGPDGQKGWIYQIVSQTSPCKCYFCGVTFKPMSNYCGSWVGSQQKNELKPFDFEEDIWDLRHFYEKPHTQLLNFQTFHLEWYKLQVKKYIYYLLKSHQHSSSSSIKSKFLNLRQFGKIIKQQQLQRITDISREEILTYIDINEQTVANTLIHKLSDLRKFLEWSQLEISHLIRSRDFPKKNKDDTNWLDEVTRTAIKQHLNKIPASIARHYLIQEYTAARPGDICQMTFDCLIEENGKWYVKLYQCKNNKGWHRIPANREIRRIIEEQQQWIRETLGVDYSYLFCHYRSIRTISYPNFSNIKPLPAPPKTNANNNPMVRIIRLLIENENILDSNGQKPYFTGRITRSSRLQEVRAKHGIEAAQLLADHKSSRTTFQHYAPPTREEVAKVDLPFQELLMNPENKFLPWQSLPESLLKSPKAHELDIEIAPRLVVYGYCILDPKTPCIYNLYPKCYDCHSFCPSTGKLPFYERQYAGEQQRMEKAKEVEAELAYEEAKATLEAMDKWLPELRKLANG